MVALDETEYQNKLIQCVEVVEREFGSILHVRMIHVGVTLSNVVQSSMFFGSGLIISQGKTLKESSRESMNPRLKESENDTERASNVNPESGSKKRSHAPITGKVGKF